ncbi:putative dual specificity protein phosphatase DSP8 [Acorus gramineus]|uniref:Dual specificity protein phosphatase DSP8 n=1 Tax=Acorus gramineus TaxID=55184 RepID=A0AAV9BII6_ACOGR|nr:putative dual specificity protein phosphatase DSP8 [Acorus gramineus]
MGISKLIGLKATILFFIFVYLRGLGITLVPIVFLHASLVSFLVSFASHPSVNLPLLLGKSSDGSFPLWSVVLFGPYLAFIRTFVFLRRLRSREPLYTEISEGLYVGGWPSSVGNLPPGEPAVIDCTCELPRSSSVLKNSYLCVATWDTRAPLPSQIESAVRWACRKRAQGKSVFVHCAFGHGRSVSVTCALLVELGLVEDWKSAEKLIKEKRPCIRMNALHRKSLEEWSKNRLSTKRNERTDVSSVILSSASRN